MNNTKNLLDEIIKNGNRSAAEKLNFLNQRRDLISEERFEELEKICMDQMINPLFDRDFAA
ncbi:hypothetical protein [Fodinibius sp. Rm-B-1B1-1]|uniref:hypothetical protein n=1 Tax=Fodinibius alkaliphilus TaxID=3140241 RepID=UPI00315AB806